MTKTELHAAETLLMAHTQRTESIHLEGGGYAITAYWLTGGQRLYYSLDSVQADVADISERAMKLDAE